MILQLRVENVALIEKVELCFGPGLNILSGETGAGKSILIDSINFLLGGRPGKDFIRSGADTALVEGILEVNDEDFRKTIDSMGIELAEDNQLLLSRSLNSQGRNTCRANGHNLTVGMLREISAGLVDVHGQHQHHSLLNSNKHIVLLDRFCGDELNTLKTQLSELIKHYREISRELKELSGAPGQREAQIEIWQFQIDEISQAKLRAGEEEELSAKRDRLNAVDKLSKNAGEALFLLHGGTTDLSATDQIGKALQLLIELVRYDESKQPLADRLQELSIQLADVVEELSDYNHQLDADPHTLEKLESRLDIIYRLKKKYNKDIEGILAHYETIKAQMEKLSDSEASIDHLQKKRREAMQAIAAKCKEMSTLRHQAAQLIQSRIIEILQDLGMSKVQFAVAIEQQAAFTANGNDRLEFMISPNIGEAMKPLSQIASGGEMSRVMLALKAVTADVDRIATLIFDEIDAGVSGRTAQQVAEKLTKITSPNNNSVARQILCITHIPQIAAMADSHYLISKSTLHDQTRTSIQQLSHKETIQELARLIGGAQITDATLKAAEEMKVMADSIKK